MRAQRGDIVFDDFQPVAQLQHQGGVHDVLRGRAPMHVAAGLAALSCDLLHQRQDRIADDIGLAAQQIEVERGNLGPSRDRLRRLRRDHGAARLGLRQRDFDLGVARDQAKIGKHLAHGGRAEGIAEQDGIEDGGRGRERGHGAHRLRLDGDGASVAQTQALVVIALSLLSYVVPAFAGTTSRLLCVHVLAARRVRALHHLRPS